MCSPDRSPHTDPGSLRWVLIERFCKRFKALQRVSGFYRRVLWSCGPFLGHAFDNPLLKVVAPPVKRALKPCFGGLILFKEFLQGLEQVFLSGLFILVKRPMAYSIYRSAKSPFSKIENPFKDVILST